MTKYRNEGAKIIQKKSLERRTTIIFFTAQIKTRRDKLVHAQQKAVNSFIKLDRGMAMHLTRPKITFARKG